MSNPWIQHVKSFAQQHGISYACAVSTPACSKSYKEKNGVVEKTKPKAKPMAAVKTLTTAPRIVPTPTPAKAAPPPPPPNSGYLSTNRSNKHLLKQLPKEWLQYFNKFDSDNTRILKIALLKDGVKFDKYISVRDLDKLYWDNYRRKNNIILD